MDDEIKILLEENENLKKQIEALNAKLRVVKVWMEKEVKNQIYKIAKSKFSKFASNSKDNFLSENLKDVIVKKINSYFGDLLLLNAPKGTIEGIVSAEINYFNMIKNPSIDGFAVISAYHKVLDLLIESLVTNNFRKFAKKRGQTILRVNDPLEKFLNLVVNSKYIMSVGRLYGLLKAIKEGGILYDYGKCFKEYLDKYKELKGILLDDIFFEKFTKLNKSEVLSSKRHSGIISKKETTEARKILIGNFKDKTSIIYKMLEGQSVMY